MGNKKILIIEILMISSLFLFNNICISEEGWEPEEEISSDYIDTKQYYPSVAVDNELIHVTWCELTPTNWKIIYRYNDGSQWQVNQSITFNSVNNFQPVMAADNDKVHVAWQYYDSGIDQDIYYKSFNGITWSSPFEVSSDTTSETQENPNIAVDGDNCYLIWEDYDGGDVDIQFRHFNGLNWGTEFELSNDIGTENQLYPDIAAANGKIHAVWCDNGIQYRHYDGVIWQPTQKISTDVGYNPAIAVENDNVYVVWEGYQDGDWDIYFRHYDGTDWQPIQKINVDLNIEDQHQSDIAVDNGQIHVVWEDEGNIDKDIVYRYFDGLIWNPQQEISIDSGNEDQHMPAIDVKNNIVHAIWQDDEDGHSDIVYRHRIINTTYPAPKVFNIDVQGGHDNNHITNHTPLINWTHFDELSLSQKGFNASVWSGNFLTGSLMGFYNGSGTSKNWTYLGNELIDGQTYFACVQTHNGFNWSQWKFQEFTMNSPPPQPYGPNYDLDIVNIGSNNSIILTWESDDDEQSDIINSVLFGDLDINPPITEFNPIENSINADNIYDDGIYYWQVRLFDGYEWTYGPIWYFSVIKNDNPILNNDNVIPSNGDVTTTFKFSVEYFDEDNDSPVYLYLNIDNMNYSMVGYDNSDTDYTDGKKYEYFLQFQPGNYSYQFLTSDGELDFFTTEKYILVELGSLDNIAIEPSTVTLSTDEYIIFKAKGFDKDNNLLSISPKWEISGGGIIDNYGNFTATKPGTWFIYANISGISGIATVTVIGGNLNQIIIIPEEVNVTVNDFVLFQAVGYDSYNNLIPILPEWEVSGGGIITQDGNFTASTLGEWIIYANISGINAQAKVTVILSAITEIAISPKYLELNIPETYKFSAKGYDKFNNEIDISPSWETNGGGFVSEIGEFTAQTPGTWVIFANYSGISGNAIIKINQPDKLKDNNGEDNDSFVFIIGILVFIIIIIFIVILVFFNIFKKKQEREELRNDNVKKIQPNTTQPLQYQNQPQIQNQSLVSQPSQPPQPPIYNPPEKF